MKVVNSLVRSGRLYALRERGRTLLEVVIVVAIVAVVAAAALPAQNPVQESTLNLAAAGVADAARFARERAKHYGSPHGVEVDRVNQRIRVFRLNVEVSPPEHVYDVYHPVSKQLYSLEFGSAPYTSVTLNAGTASFSSSCNDQGSVVFDSYGVARCSDPLTSRYSRLTIGVELNGVERSVSIDGFHGRVSAQ